jgi:hypothetical protein
MEKINKALTLLVLATTPLLAQRMTTFQADVRGSGNSGKCTIEVDVDGTAEIEIRGTTGRMRTIAGQPARWVRFQCDAPFPTGGMNDFRFRGIDGRGRQTLLRDPRNNGGVAVIGIEDRDGGSEGYTFDIEWRDGYFGSGGGFGRGRNRDGYDYERDRGFGRDGGFGRGNDQARAIRICQDAVRDRANRDHGVGGLEFDRTSIDNNRGREDWIVGTARDRGSRDRYEFACSVDLRDGSVRSVDLRRR